MYLCFGNSASLPCLCTIFSWLAFPSLPELCAIWHRWMDSTIVALCASTSHRPDRVSNWAAARWPGGRLPLTQRQGFAMHFEGLMEPFPLSSSAAHHLAGPHSSPGRLPQKKHCLHASTHANALPLRATTHYSSPSAMFINVGTSSRDSERHSGGTAGVEEGLDSRAILLSCSSNYDISSKPAD